MPSCPNCGEDNPERARFCMARTAPLGAVPPTGARKYSSRGTTYSVRRRALYLKKELISRLVIENCLLSESQ